MEKEKKKSLSPKQQKALELLTSGRGLTYREIAAEVGIAESNLWRWRNDPRFAYFQEELKRLNDIRWQAAEDAARESCVELCKAGNQKMVQFVLQNLGYNPTTKIKADVRTDINIEIDE